MIPLEQLPKNRNQVRLPNKKSSLYELSRIECRQYFRALCQEFYPYDWADLMKEYSDAVRDEPEGVDGVRVQLSSLMAYWFWWI